MLLAREELIVLDFCKHMGARVVQSSCEVCGAEPLGDECEDACGGQVLTRSFNGEGQGAINMSACERRFCPAHSIPLVSESIIAGAKNGIIWKPTKVLHVRMRCPWG